MKKSAKETKNISLTADQIISDTSMMFLACACYSLHERNNFGKQRLMQFVADVTQVDRENEYSDITAALKEKVGLDFPAIERT